MFANHKLKTANKTLEEIYQSIEEEKSIRDNLQLEYLELEHKIAKLQKNIKKLQGIETGYIEMQEELGYEFIEANEPPSVYESNIMFYEKCLADLVGTKQHYLIKTAYKVDGSEAKGRKFQEGFIKNIYNGFNAYYSSKKKIVKNETLTQNIALIEKSFEKFSKQGALIGISLNPDYLFYCTKILTTIAKLKIAKSLEKEKIKEEKRRLREQEKLLEEAEKAKQQLEKERKEYELALAKSISEEEQEAIRTKLAEIDSREADIDYRITQQKAGWLYVITSKSLPELCKVGCTRRLSPFERIKELSSASLPFPFVSRGIVFSEDVFALENAIHKRLDAYRVNKENLHKEFFKIDPAEVVKILREEFNCEVQFIREEDEDE